MKRHFRTDFISVLVLFSSAAVGLNCSDEPEPTDYVARVNDVYLKEVEIQLRSENDSLSETHKENYIRNWINSELIYQEAVDEDVLQDEEFKLLLNKAERDIAKTIHLKRKLEDLVVSPDYDDLKNFYEANREAFKLLTTAYYLNLVTFSDEDKAVDFRRRLQYSDWKKTLDYYEDDPGVITSIKRELRYEFNFYSGNLLRVLAELRPGEVSFVVDTNPARFTIVKLIEKYNEGEIPDYEIITEKVKAGYIEDRKKEMLNQYIRELYSKNEIEIK